MNGPKPLQNGLAGELLLSLKKRGYPSSRHRKRERKKGRNSREKKLKKRTGLDARSSRREMEGKSESKQSSCEKKKRYTPERARKEVKGERDGAEKNLLCGPFG